MSNELFFGIEVKPSTVYSYNVSQPLQFTMATIKNAENSPSRTLVYIELNNVQFTICSLLTQKFEQQVLNLKIQKGVQIKIWSNGPNSVQLLGTYSPQKSTKTSPTGPLEQVSVSTGVQDDKGICYYPMTKEQHGSLVEYQSEAALAEREAFVNKFNTVMDILDSIEDPQPILDKYLSKYKNKKRALEDLDKVFNHSQKKKQKVSADKTNLEQPGKEERSVDSKKKKSDVEQKDVKEKPVDKKKQKGPVKEETTDAKKKQAADVKKEQQKSKADTNNFSQAAIKNMGKKERMNLIKKLNYQNNKDRQGKKKNNKQKQQKDKKDQSKSNASAKKKTQDDTSHKQTKKDKTKSTPPPQVVDKKGGIQIDIPR